MPFVENLIKTAFSATVIDSGIDKGIYSKYDHGVQEVLDQYWPGTTDLSNIKRGDRMVYSAQYEGKEVIVKSTGYSEELEKNTQQYIDWVNFIGEQVSVANFINPSQEHSDDEKKLVTMSKFAEGVCPQCLYDNPSIWWTDEEVVRSVGTYLGNMRLASQEFTKAQPETYATFPQWDTINDGWETAFTPITIPVTDESFGIIHGDLHEGNMMIDPLNDYAMTILDLDNAQKSWYIIDLGTVVFGLNMDLYTTVYMPWDENGVSYDSYQVWFDQFKFWITDSYAEAYGSPVDPAELTQGCGWRKDFLYTYFGWLIPTSTGDTKAYYQAYVDFYDSGNMPSC